MSKWSKLSKKDKLAILQSKKEGFNSFDEGGPKKSFWDYAKEYYAGTGTGSMHGATNTAANTHKELMDNPELRKPYMTAAAAALVPGLLTVAAPAVSAGWGAFATAMPKTAVGIKVGAELAGAADFIRNQVTGKGVTKTYNHLKNGEYWDATKSGLVDVLDIMGTVDAVKFAKRLGTRNRIAKEMVKNIDNINLNNIIDETPITLNQQISNKAKIPEIEFKKDKVVLHRNDAANSRHVIKPENERLGKTKWERNNKFTVNEPSTSMVDMYLINKSKTPYTFENGKMVWSNKGAIRPSVHFTTDMPVISHPSGNWDGASEMLLTPYKGVVENNGQPLSIEPMDTFFGNPNNFVIPEYGSKIITSDRNNYLKYTLAKQKNVHFLEDGAQLTDKINSILAKPGKLSHTDLSELRNTEEALSEIFRNYVRENVPRPTMKDYKLMRNETGLKSSVFENNGEGIMNVNGILPHGNVRYGSFPEIHSTHWIAGRYPGRRFPSIKNEPINTNLNRTLKHRMGKKDLQTRIHDLERNLEEAILQLDTAQENNWGDDYVNRYKQTVANINEDIMFLQNKTNYPKKYIRQFENGGRTNTVRQ